MPSRPEEISSPTAAASTLPVTSQNQSRKLTFIPTHVVCLKRIDVIIEKKEIVTEYYALLSDCYNSKQTNKTRLRRHAYGKITLNCYNIHAIQTSWQKYRWPPPNRPVRGTSRHRCSSKMSTPRSAVRINYTQINVGHLTCLSYSTWFDSQLYAVYLMSTLKYYITRWERSQTEARATSLLTHRDWAFFNKKISREF